jgi:hypothetical protein
MSGWPSEVRGGFQVFSAAVGVCPAPEPGVRDKTATTAAVAVARSKYRPLIGTLLGRSQHSAFIIQKNPHGSGPAILFEAKTAEYPSQPVRATVGAV